MHQPGMMHVCEKCKVGSFPEKGMPCPTPSCGPVGGTRLVVPRLPPAPAWYTPSEAAPAEGVEVRDDVYERAIWVEKGVRHYQWRKVTPPWARRPLDAPPD